MEHQRQTDELNKKMQAEMSARMESLAEQLRLFQQREQQQQPSTSSTTGNATDSANVATPPPPPAETMDPAMAMTRASGDSPPHQPIRPSLREAEEGFEDALEPTAEGFWNVRDHTF